MAHMESPVNADTVIRQSSEHFDVIVIGGGQAGLSVGASLVRQGRRFVILDARDRIGDIWRSRWDTLRLFTPARYDGLPGMPFPLARHDFPTRDQMADYLETYAERVSLPVRTGVRVDDVWPAGDGQSGYVVTAGEMRFTASQVVIATGAQEGPHVPAFASKLHPGIRQLHSSEYRNPDQLQDGDVLVVGAGNSGAEIAIETAGEHHAVLAGKYPGHVPFRIERPAARVILPILWFLGNHVLSIRTPMGRKVSRAIRSGHAGPLVRVKPSDVVAAGVERTTSRVAGVRDGMPMLDDGRVLEVTNVVWCTGFRNQFSWIHLPVFDEDGYPIQERGVVPSSPGLYFIGLPFLYSFGSMLVGGVGRDAAHIADRIAEHSAVA